jgi:hypothetical protein
MIDDDFRIRARAMANRQDDPVYSDDPERIGHRLRKNTLLENNKLQRRITHKKRTDDTPLATVSSPICVNSNTLTFKRIYRQEGEFGAGSMKTDDQKTLDSRNRRNDRFFDDSLRLIKTLARKRWAWFTPLRKPLRAQTSADTWKSRSLPQRSPTRAQPPVRSGKTGHRSLHPVLARNRRPP